MVLPLVCGWRGGGGGGECKSAFYGYLIIRFITTDARFDFIGQR